MFVRRTKPRLRHFVLERDGGIGKEMIWICSSSGVDVPKSALLRILVGSDRYSNLKLSFGLRESSGFVVFHFHTYEFYIKIIGFLRLFSNGNIFFGSSQN